MAYKKIDIIGPPSVKALKSEEIPRGNCCVFLLMGQTGSGKSSFIEAIANSKGLGIAKDQLEAYTQEITAYRLINVQQVNHPSNPVLIIDTPGFADRRFPESRTLRLVQEWVERHELYFAQILYFDRITDPRMPGSKSKLLDMFKAITGDDTGKTISITTTMWDQLWRDDQISRANKRFAEMSTIYYKDFVDDGARVLKFENTHESAISIIDGCLTNFSPTYFEFESMVMGNADISSTSFCRLLQINLLERRATLLQHLKALDDDLSAIPAESNPELHDNLFKQKTETVVDLAMVENELKGFPEKPPEDLIPTPRRGIANKDPKEGSKSRAMTHDAFPSAGRSPRAIFRQVKRIALGSSIPRPRSAPPESDSLRGVLDRGTQQVKSVFHRHK